ncbi:hypothetical protein M513_07283, partial [Trichuris suis]
NGKTPLPPVSEHIRQQTKLPLKKTLQSLELERSLLHRVSSNWSWLKSDDFSSGSLFSVNNMQTLRKVLRPVAPAAEFPNSFGLLEAHGDSGRRIHTNVEHLFSFLEPEHFDTEYEHIEPVDEYSSYERFHKLAKETLSSIHDATALKVDESEDAGHCT